MDFFRVAPSIQFSVNAQCDSIYSFKSIHYSSLFQISMNVPAALVNMGAYVPTTLTNTRAHVSRDTRELFVQTVGQVHLYSPLLSLCEMVHVQWL